MIQHILMIEDYLSYSATLCVCVCECVYAHAFYMKLKIGFSTSVKSCTKILLEIVMNLQISFGRMAV